VIDKVQRDVAIEEEEIQVLNKEDDDLRTCCDKAADRAAVISPRMLAV
jgi:hypothetical protein